METATTAHQVAQIIVDSCSPIQKAHLDAELGLGVAPYQHYAADPVGFSTEILSSVLTPGQIEVLESVRDHRITVVQSGNSVGKTFAGGDMAHWALHALPNSKTITCAAPPLENLQRLLWGEIGSRALAHPGIMEGVQVRSLHYAYSPEWWLVGVAIPASGTVEEREAKFSGKHADYLLFIVDEGDAVPPEVYKGIESCMTGGWARLVVFFNPRYQGGPVQKLIDDGANLVVLDAFSHPNVIEGREVIPGGTVDRSITIERIYRWTRPQAEGDVVTEEDPQWFQIPDFLDGESVTLSDGTVTSPLAGGEWRRVKDEYPEFSYMVLARFPGQSAHQLIPQALIKRAQDLWLLRRELMGDAPPEDIRPIGALDVADFGIDSNVLCLRYANWVAPFLHKNGVDPTTAAEWAAEICYEANCAQVQTDAIGDGAGCHTTMNNAWPAEFDCIAAQVKVSWSPIGLAEGDPDFYQYRDQLYWALRTWFRSGGAMIPPNEKLARQLSIMKYSYGVRGEIRVTRKVDMRKLLNGRSPDEMEALILSLAEGDNAVPLGFA